jgi:hypothetical protein
MGPQTVLTLGFEHDLQRAYHQAEGTMTTDSVKG